MLIFPGRIIIGFILVGESHVNPLEFGVTVEYPTQLTYQNTKGPANLFDGDVMEFDHTYFSGQSNQPTSESTPQM